MIKPDITTNETKCKKIMNLKSSTETMILSHLLTNEDYTRKVLPFLKIKYFEGNDHQIVFDEIYKFVDKYKNIPSKECYCNRNERGHENDDHDLHYKLTKGMIQYISIKNFKKSKFIFSQVFPVDHLNPQFQKFHPLKVNFHNGIGEEPDLRKLIG